MPLAKIRQDYTPLPPAAPPAQLATDLSDVAAAPSPALALQKHLSQRAVALGSPEIEKWSTRRSLALIVSASAALWLGIIMAFSQAARLIA